MLLRTGLAGGVVACGVGGLGAVVFATYTLFSLNTMTSARRAAIRNSRNGLSMIVRHPSGSTTGNGKDRTGTGTGTNGGAPLLILYRKFNNGGRKGLFSYLMSDLGGGNVTIVEFSFGNRNGDRKGFRSVAMLGRVRSTGYVLHCTSSLP